MNSPERHLKPVDAPGAKRRLAAILSADVAGYSRLMGTDETGTHERLRAYRREIDGLIARHDGRVVQTGGDSVLADFPSVIEALGAAVDMQRALGEQNAALPADQRLDFRIGINVGDVIVDGDDIFGDGVNIAARVQALADPGGIWISGKVYDEVRTKLGLGFRDRGTQSVKNIAEPIRVYSVELEGRSAGRAVRVTGRMWQVALAGGLAAVVVAGTIGLWLARQSPEKTDRIGADAAAEAGSSAEMRDQPGPDAQAVPTIAVLPFDNQSGDPDQVYFSDGITEDIISALGRFSNLLVMSWDAVAPYKARAVTPEQLSREVGIRYVVDGSVRRAGDRMRVTARLTDADRGLLLWSERYDRAIDDIFAVQDDITQQIVGTLAVKMSDLEQERAFSKPTDNLAAYDYVLRGRQHLFSYERSANLKAQELFEKAIDRDPRYGDAYVGLGRAYLLRAELGWTEWPHQALERAYELAQEALRLDPSNADAHGVLATVYTYRKRYDLALEETARALELNPNSVEIHGDRGWALLTSGASKEAIEAFETALRFNPHAPSEFFVGLGMAHVIEGQHDDAINFLERGLGKHPDFAPIHVALAAAYAAAGREADAARAAANVRRLQPFFEVDAFGEYFQDPADRKRLAAALRKAGLE